MPGLFINRRSRTGILPVFPGHRLEACATAVVNNPGLAVIVLLAACTSCQDYTAQSSGYPPEKIVDCELWIMDRCNPRSTIRNPQSNSAGTDPEADCELCHVDVVDELKGGIHPAEGVGCVKCHGPSDGHVLDENNDVLPDRVYPREKIDKFCESCHECSRPKATKPALGGPEKHKVCTECHGAHKIVLGDDRKPSDD